MQSGAKVTNTTVDILNALTHLALKSSTQVPCEQLTSPPNCQLAVSISTYNHYATFINVMSCRTGTYWRLTEVASEWLCAWICGHTLPYVTFPKPNKRGNVLHVWRNTEARSRSHCCRGKNSKYYIVWVCVCSLSSQRAKRMRRISPVACLVLPFFLHFLINDTIFGKMSLNIKCVFRFSLQLLSETFLILRRIERQMYVDLHVKCPLFFSDFNKNLNFRDRFSKNPQI
jgi:hypothetical protein